MMRYCAIDIETTGLDPERHQVLELACVAETDWRTPVEELPSFRTLCSPGEVRGEVTALAMNQRLLQELTEKTDTPPLTIALLNLHDFISEHVGAGSINIAGKNFGAFDFQFLRRNIQWQICFRHKRRFIDVGNLWWNPVKDSCLPNLEQCVERAKTQKREAHSALEDCRTVVELVRKRFA